MQLICGTCSNWNSLGLLPQSSSKVYLFSAVLYQGIASTEITHRHMDTIYYWSTGSTECMLVLTKPRFV